MSRPKPKLADHVYLVMGQMPYEFTKALSAWVTDAAAEDEVRRLNELIHEDLSNASEAKLREVFNQTDGCSYFYVERIDVMHKEAEHDSAR